MQRHNFRYLALGGGDKRPMYLNPSPELERLSRLQTETGLKNDELLIEYAARYQQIQHREPAMYQYLNGGTLHPAYQLHRLFPSAKAKQWEIDTAAFYAKRGVVWICP